MPFFCIRCNHLGGAIKRAFYFYVEIDVKRIGASFVDLRKWGGWDGDDPAFVVPEILLGMLEDFGGKGGHEFFHYAELFFFFVGGVGVGEDGVEEGDGVFGPAFSSHNNGVNRRVGELGKVGGSGGDGGLSV